MSPDDKADTLSIRKMLSCDILTAKRVLREMKLNKLELTFENALEIRSRIPLGFKLITRK